MKKSNIIKVIVAVASIVAIGIIVCILFVRRPVPIGYGIKFGDSVEKIMEERELTTEVPEQFRVFEFSELSPYEYYEVIDENTFISYLVTDGKVGNVSEHNLITKDDPEEVEAIIADIEAQMTEVYGEPIAVFGENDLEWLIVDDYNYMEGYYSVAYENGTKLSYCDHWLTINVDGDFQWNGDC